MTPEAVFGLHVHSWVCAHIDSKAQFNQKQPPSHGKGNNPVPVYQVAMGVGMDTSVFYEFPA